MGAEGTGKEIVRRASDDEPVSGLLAFKIMSDPYVGQAHVLRRCLLGHGSQSGSSVLLNATTQRKKERDRAPPVRMHANKREEVEEVVHAGQIIAAAVGLRRTRFDGRTPSATSIHPLIARSRCTFPDPVISVAIEPKTKADQDKLSAWRSTKLVEEDPTFRVKVRTKRLRVRPSSRGWGSSTSRSWWIA